MGNRLRRVPIALLVAIGFVRMTERPAYADMAGGTTPILFGLAALLLAGIVVLLALVALVVIIHYLRKDHREGKGRDSGPVPPNGR